MKKILLLLLLSQAALGQNSKLQDAQTTPNSSNPDDMLFPPLKEQFEYRIKAKLNNRLNTIQSMYDTCAVGYFIKTTNRMYTYFNGDTAAIRAFVIAMFPNINQVAKHDGMYAYIDSIAFSPDSDNISTNNGATSLYNFSAMMDSSTATADLFQVWDFSPYGIGGIAYVGVLGSSRAYRVSYCNLYTAYYTYPAYSWNILVTSHEGIGHNIGSQHTHWCGWQFPNGTTHPIDCCYTCEGSCYSGVSKPRWGTIMSYCHLTASSTSGIDFNLGFYYIIKKLLRQNLYNAKLAGYLKDPYHYNQISNIVINPQTFSANINWISYSTKFRYQFRLKGATTWTTVIINGSGVTIMGLSSQTNYQFRVQSQVYGGVWLAYSKIINFKTQ